MNKKELHSLKEKQNTTKKQEYILKEVGKLDNDLRKLGNIDQRNKPLIVAAILLALSNKDFKIEHLTGDKNNMDGMKIFQSIKDCLNKSGVSPQFNLDKILSQFSFIKSNLKINTKNTALDETPIKYFTKFLNATIFPIIKKDNTAEDFLGIFYSGFMSNSGDGQNLGIVLTPKHITELFCELLELKDTDRVIDPCCGTAGFLIASIHHMLKGKDKKKDAKKISNIKENQLFGIEEQSYMFTIGTTNMILRGGKSNLINNDFFNINPNDLQLKGYTVGMINPPYSMGSKKNDTLYEMNFINHLLDSMTKNGRVAAIVPLSTLIGTKTNFEKQMKKRILDNHTLEGVITLNPNTFYGVGVSPCIVVFKARVPHPKDKLVKFIDFTDDGYEVNKHVGLVETLSASDKKQNLLNLWFGTDKEKPKTYIESKITIDDEWLYSYFYFNNTIPTEKDFKKVLGEYLTFEVKMIVNNRDYLFK